MGKTLSLNTSAIRAEAGANGDIPTLHVNGEVGVHFTGADLAAAVEYYGETRIVLNTPGGFVTDAFHFYDYVRANGLKVHVDGYGQVSSAGTIIMAAAGSKRSRLAPNAVFLVHNVSGNAPQDVLEQENDKLRSIYVELTGLSRRRVKELMDADKPITAAMAAELGFVGSVMELQKLAARANNTQDMEVTETVEATEVETPVTAEAIETEVTNDAESTETETTIEVEVDVTANDLVNAVMGKKKVVAFNVSKFYGETVENLTAELKERITALDEVKSELEAKTAEVDSLKAEADKVPTLVAQVDELTKAIEALRSKPLANSTAPDAAPEVVVPAAAPEASASRPMTRDERKAHNAKELDRIASERYGKKTN